jgi:SAM-dependent methyltransferase
MNSPTVEANLATDTGSGAGTGKAGSASELLGARRLCLSCGAPSAIGEEDRLWPPSWRCQKCGHVPPRSNDIVLLAPAQDQENEGFDPESFDLLAEVEAEHFWFVARNELICWLVRRFAANARRVLEIGCGSGFALYALREALPEAQIAGGELHSAGLAIASRRHGDAVELLQMDACDSGLVYAVDLVGAFDVLEHIADDGAALRGIARMLKPGGTLIATVPQHPWLWSTADAVAHHQRRYRPHELAEKAAAAGLEPIYRSSFMTLALPLMVTSRILERNRAVPHSLEEQIAAEFRLSPVTNAAMLLLARGEHLLRQTGMPLPWGGSQILVVRRPLRPSP